MEYKGWIVPVMGRVCFEKDWKNKAETFNGFIREMKKYLKDLGGQVPEEEPLGNRYFWNNDCLVRKTDKEYLLLIWRPTDVTVWNAPKRWQIRGTSS